MPGRPGALVGDGNTAVPFNGIDGVSLGDLSALDFGSDDFSVTAWVKTSVNGERAIVGKVEQSTLTPNWIVTVTDDTGQVGRIRAKIFDGGTTTFAYGPNLRVDNGSWHQIGVAFDRDYRVSVYVDGIEQVTPGLSTGVVSNAGTFAIGKAVGYSSFQGDLDEVSFFGGQVLDPMAFSAYYEAGASPSERTLVLEDPTIVDESPGTLDDTPTILPGYNSDLVPSARPGDPAFYAAEKDAAWNAYLQSGGVPEDDPTSPGDATGVVIDPHQGGLEGDRSPSDTTLATGRTRVIQVVNRVIAMYNKSDLGRVAGPVYMHDFARHCVNDFVFADPQIMWDIETKRWYYVVLQRSRTNQDQNCISYGWSQGPNPTSLTQGWCHFHTTVTRIAEDVPKLGDNRIYLTIGTNVFGSAHQASVYRYSRLQVIRKPTARRRNRCRWPMSVWSSRGYAPDDLRYPASPVPANGVNAQEEAYAVGIDRGLNKLWVWRIRRATQGQPCQDGRTSGPCFYDFKISLNPWPLWYIPANAPQPPPTPPQPPPPDPAMRWFLDDGWGQFVQAVSLYDSNANRLAIWTQNTVGLVRTRRARLRWYEIIPAQQGFRQRDKIVKPLHWVFNGAISPAANGREAMIQYNTASETELVKVFARARRSSTPLGSFGNEQLVWTSTATYYEYSCGTQEFATCRWGDYAGAAPDPRRPRRIWATNQATKVWDQILPPWTTRNFAGRASP